MLTQDEINELAIRDQENGRVSIQLWRAVERISYKVVNKLIFDTEERSGIVAESICEALRMYEPDRGRFSYTVQCYSIKMSHIYLHNMQHIVRMPMHWRGEQLGSITDVNPDGMFDIEGNETDYWDHIVQSEDFVETIFGDEFSDHMAILKKGVDTILTDKEKKVYDLIYIHRINERACADILGCSRQNVNKVHERMRCKLSKFVKKQDIINTINSK